MSSTLKPSSAPTDAATARTVEAYREARGTSSSTCSATRATYTAVTTTRHATARVTGRRFASPGLGYPTAMLYTILIILAIVALLIFIFGRRPV